MYYKIVFFFKSPIVFIEPPIFDSILAFCYMRHTYGDFNQKLNISELNEQIDFFKVLPLTISENEGKIFFQASWLFFDSDKRLEANDSFKKRFDFFNDDILFLGKGNGRIVINKGEFKSYDIPITTHAIKEGWFFFGSENLEYVIFLISKCLYGIGKKTAYGYGAIRTFHVERLDYNPFENAVLRPIPTNDPSYPFLQYCAFRPPYWAPHNFSLCKVK